MSMKFGGKQTMKDKVAMVEARYGQDYGKGNGSKPTPQAKVKPILKKGTVGFKVTKKI